MYILRVPQKSFLMSVVPHAKTFIMIFFQQLPLSNINDNKQTNKKNKQEKNNNVIVTLYLT